MTARQVADRLGLSVRAVYAHAAPSHLQQWANAVREPGKGTGARGTGRKAA